MNLKRLKEEIQKEIFAEKKVYDYMENRKTQLAPGSLYIQEGSIKPYYYQSIYEGDNRYYITLDQTRDEDREVIKELVEKKTIVHGMPLLKKNISALEVCVGKIEPYSAMNYKYGHMLGKDYYLEGDICIKDWNKKPECQNMFYPENKVHDTKKGIKVRSKSEALICDCLFDEGIIVKYETELRFEGKRFYPDVEFIHPYEHRLMWWEHLGKMDDPRYVLDNMERLDVFHRNGIVWGDNLILTWETRDNPLTRGMVRLRLEEYGIV